MRPPRRAARATRSYANDGEGEDKAMLDAEMGSASEEEEEEEGEEEEGEEEEEEEEESVPDDDEEDEEDEESEEMIDSIDEEEEAAGFNRERATKVAGSLRVLSKRSEKKREKKRAADEFVEEQREILDRGKPLQRDSILRILGNRNIDHATKHELLGVEWPFKKCKHEGCARNAHRIAFGRKGECSFHERERRKKEPYKKEKEAKKRSDALRPKCWRCGINPGRRKNFKKGIVSKVGPRGIGSEPVSRGVEMFCHACRKECHKTHPVTNIYRYVKNMQCCDCNDILAADGLKVKEYFRVTDDTFRCLKCWRRVYDQQKKSFWQRLFPNHGGQGSIPTTRKCVNCECTAQDYKGTWFKVNKIKVLHFFFQSYRCHKCYAAEEEKGKNKKA